MTKATKRPPRRRYDSPHRREQAAATRHAILAAAQRLFERDGYTKTSIAAIADEAGVATKTVYLAFETKSGLLRALWHLLLRGERDEVPVGQQQWYREVLEEPDPARQIELDVRNSLVVKKRAGALMEVIRGAAPADPDAAALWNRIQIEFHDNQRTIVKSIAKKKALKRGVDVEHGADILWSLIHPALWQLLVGERGWSTDRYEKWLAETLRSQLLGS
jgi:AcrR family transcriptional regulator